MSSGLYSGVSGLAIGSGLYKGVSSLWGGASGLINGFGGGGGTPTTPALYIDFTSGVLDPRITFARSSTATYTSSAGAITLAAVDQPRFDYFPDSLLPRGLMLEGSRTNVLLNALINGTSLSTQSVTVTAQTYTLSFYGTGQIVLSGAASATVTGSGVYPNRRTYTFTPSAGSLTLTVTGTVQYAQLEAGAFVSSFIPTAGTAVTRAADSAVMTGTNFSSWYTNLTGTFGVGAEPAFGTTTQTPSIVLLTDADVINYQALYVNGSTSGISYAGWYGGMTLDFIGQQYATYPLPASQFNLTSNIAPQNFIYGQAAAYATDDFADSGNGQFPSLDTSGIVPTYMTQLTFGPTSGTLGYGGWFGWIRNFTYYGSRLTNAQLQVLSTTAGSSSATLDLNFLQQVYSMGTVPVSPVPILATDFLNQVYVVG